jgi:hypothetical protein
MKFHKVLLLILITFSTAACANAVDEEFDYSSYNQQSSYSASHFEQLAKKCSATPNLISQTDAKAFRACKTATTAVTTNISIFSADLSVQRMCVFPVVIQVDSVQSVLRIENNAIQKICGTITGTGSTAVISSAAFNGLLMVEGSDASAVENCLVSSDFRGCMAGVKYYEALL